MKYVFYFTFFFTAAHFHLALVAASISSCCSSNNVLVFIDSLVVSASQDAGGYSISRRLSRQNNLALHFGCHTLIHSFFICHIYKILQRKMEII